MDDKNLKAFRHIVSAGMVSDRLSIPKIRSFTSCRSVHAKGVCRKKYIKGIICHGSYICRAGCCGGEDLVTARTGGLQPFAKKILR
jgi:hypothetical protein